jgi:hypothetical protein
LELEAASAGVCNREYTMERENCISNGTNRIALSLAGARRAAGCLFIGVRYFALTQTLTHDNAGRGTTLPPSTGFAWPAPLSTWTRT